MFGLVLLSVALIVDGQLLDATQHAALMTFYDAVGAFVGRKSKKKEFLLFHPSVQAATARSALASW